MRACVVVAGHTEMFFVPGRANVNQFCVKISPASSLQGADWLSESCTRINSRRHAHI